MKLIIKKALIYQYLVTAAPNSYVNNVTLVLQKNRPQCRYDYSGFAFSSDGINCYEKNGTNKSVLSLVFGNEGQNKYAVIMNYDSPLNRFSPIAHSKIGNWK